MKPERTKAALLAMFLVFLAAQLVGFCVMGVRDRLWPEDLVEIMKNVLAVYLVPLSIILTGLFAQRKSASRKVSVSSAWMALGCAVTWNLLVSMRSFMFCFAESDSPALLAQYLDTMGLSLSILVVAPLTFLFAKKE